jgi:hypothetical protein
MAAHIQAMADTLPEKPTARAAAQKRKAADRARKYRERKKRAGAPLAAAVDKAVSEAVAFSIKKRGVKIGIDPTRLLKTARLILERDGYTPAEAAKAVADRMVVPRDEHSWPAHFPTTTPGPIENFRDPIGGPWTTPLAKVIKHMSSI